VYVLLHIVAVSLDQFAGYGGAVSVYIGLSAGLQMVDASFFNFALQNNAFEKCVLKSSVSGGNAYGGAVSLYIGAYSSSYSSYNTAAAVVGDTVVRNVNVLLDTCLFYSCSATRSMKSKNFFRGANVYGGSFSFYVGSYVWSLGNTSSSSTNGFTNAIDVTVSVQNITSFHSRASATNSLGLSYGANSYGGSMSVMYLGAYSWSYSVRGYSESTCGATSSRNISVHVNGSTCYNCSAISMIGTRNSLGSNSYGGSMSVLYVGVYSWSYNDASFKNSISTCGATNVSELSVNVGNLVCSNCSSLSTIGGKFSNGANSYGGSMSILYVGAYSWSWSDGVSSNSSITCGNTTTNGVSVHISRVECYNCSAMSTSKSSSNGANVYGGSISALFIGAYAFSYASGAEKIYSRSKVGATDLNQLLVTIKNVTILHALASSGQDIHPLQLLMNAPDELSQDQERNHLVPT
jgi:hypothetical protein